MNGFNSLKGGRERIIRYAPVFIWIVLIFILSSSTGSSSNTSSFIRPLLEWLFPTAPEELLAVYHGYFRKGAHLFMYGSLAAIAWRAFTGSSRVVLSKIPWLSALFLVFVIGSIDEINQSTNMLRTGQASDVLVDLCGGIIAVISISAYKRLSSHKSAD